MTAGFGTNGAQVTGPLSGVRVVDFSELGPGPYCTQCMAELGAEVIKIERPPHGDWARVLSPGGYKVLNPNKRVLMIDLKDASRRPEVEAMLREADVVVEGYRPGVMDRLGFGWEQVSKWNPRVVYVSITGFGQDGPNANMPGHDIVYMAAAGFVSLAGGLDRPPSDASGVPIADFCGGLFALSAAMAALLDARRTGRGQRLDVALVDCLIHWMNARLGHFQERGLTTLEAQRENVFSKPGYGVFATRDGEYVAIAALEPHFWERLRETLQLDLKGVPHETQAERFANSRAINAAIAERIGSMDLHEVLQRLRAADVAVTRAVPPSELPSSDQAISRDLFREVDGIRYARFPVTFTSSSKP